MNKHLIICLDEKSREGTLLFWKAKGAGYTSNIDEAGLFHEDFAKDMNLTGRDLALTREELNALARVYTVADSPLYKMKEKKEALQHA